ncbi:bifunctional helix-turn-helix transcriptional regulator/GNAT family N-acetyltransferase [Virgibacillus oceani]|uniref:GNAT family N-acetyltransferase n=1 Tax=Virgibacillus oceani TaxID=1479511 RepID=A0A917HHY0_9BACI|nr:helix-turn-helix domain-containing GNAT family N-acetyltransferase [Virgibacillus oceani]GGG78658.1 GNAT family N-acetyltransferase [Virgibacillus oceani]
MSINTFEDQVKAIRHFNRFLTRQIGVLREGLLHSPYSLAESRIIFELANHESLTSSDLMNELGLDAGYLSRIVTGLEDKGLVEKTRAEKDGRQRLLCLTSKGKDAFELLDNRSRDEVTEMLNDLSVRDQQRLFTSMKNIEEVFSKGFKYSEPYVLRPHEPGDMGWVTHRHGVLYSKEYNWDERFEALVAQIVSDFVNNYNPKKERCWIAEMDGEIVGSVFVVQESEKIAKLRLLLVEPKARGLGLGTRLVEECIRFSRRNGYEKLVLWTNSVLGAARHTYKKLGFELVGEEKHHSFGHDLNGETWELLL